MAKKIVTILLVCVILSAPQALGQASGTAYKLSNGTPVGGGGSSGSANFSIVGSVPLTGAGISTSAGHNVTGGVPGISAELKPAIPLDISYGVSSIATINAGVDRNIVVTITSGEGLDTAGVFYYRWDGTAFNPNNMTVGAGSVSFTLPGNMIGLITIQYYIKVRVGTDSAYVGSASSPYTFITRVTNEQCQRPTAMPEARYRIIGLPINPTGQSVQQVFPDDLGDPDKTRWRLGSFVPATEVVNEYPGAAGVEPGQGYWLICRGGLTYGSAGTSVRPNVTIGSDRYYRVPLELGWNQLANPFPFLINWGDVRFDDNGTIKGHDADVLEDVIYWYNGSNYDEVATIPGWDGVFVKILKTGVDALVKFEAAKITTRTVPEKPAEGWAVNLRLEVNGLIDQNNLAGVRQNALVGADEFDFSEPPPPPGGPRLAFRLPEENSCLKRVDFRPPFDDGAVWNLDIEDGSGGKLTAGGIDRIPDGMEAWLRIDSRATVRLDEGAKVTLPDGAKSAQLVIGTQEFLAIKISDGLPRHFALEQNFPNPFNPITNVIYSLPDPGHVRLEVFNVLGQRVRILNDSEMPAGRHTAVWDGTDDNGSAIASGIYFYRIQYGDFDTSRKMLLLK
ncbi:MAG: T9SS type A sorting domain-containing protein [Candidatus Zixiibacteriota bacterium]|nr:MAG: T9SS type A sorting domain-containing protein [candidate division Zixibacteria bacterium]